MILDLKTEMPTNAYWVGSVHSMDTWNKSNASHPEQNGVERYQILSLIITI